MKRMFIKMLPVMAAVLLATSCSKDDGNDAAIDTPIDNPQQTEAVSNVYKTITISGKVGKSTLSKVTVAEKQLTFEGNDTEKFSFGKEGEDVYGDITIKDAYGRFDATLNYSSEDALTKGSFTATLGTDPEKLSIGYDNLETAVQNAYYVIPFTVSKDGEEEGKFKLNERTLSKDAPSYDIKVYLQSAFIEAQTSKTITVNDDASVSVEEGKFYVVSSTATMGKDKKPITSGKIYKVKAASSVPAGYVDLGVVNAKGEHVYFAESNSEESTWNAINEAGKLDELPTEEEWVALANACYWVWGQKDGTNGMYAYKLRDGETSNYSGSSFNNDRDYSTDTDPYIFLPVTPGCSYGYYWSSTEYESDSGYAYCLRFDSDDVNPERSRGKTRTWSVRTVRRSN